MLADENQDERHAEAFVESFHLYLLNTYFVPGTILGIQRDKQNRQSVCSRGIYMLVKKIDNNQEKDQIRVS